MKLLFQRSIPAITLSIVVWTAVSCSLPVAKPAGESFAFNITSHPVQRSADAMPDYLALTTSTSWLHPLPLFTPEDVAPITANSTYDHQLTLEQESLLVRAGEIGEEIGLPETVQVILMQETLAGKLGRVGAGNHAFGVTQVKPATAKYITEINATSLDLPVYDTKADYKRALLNDDDYAIRVSAAYLAMIHEKTKGNWKRTVVSYYEGVAGAKNLTDKQIENHFYLNLIRDKFVIVTEFNKLMTAATDTVKTAQKSTQSIGLSIANYRKNKNNEAQSGTILAMNSPR